MAISPYTLKGLAFQKLGIGTREKTGEVFPRFSQKDYTSLKNDYVNQYGYTVRLPQWDDIVHLTPNALKDRATIKAEKKENLVRLLESPHPEWFQNYSSAMTWIDDIQDTASVVFPLVHYALKAAPKVMKRLLPAFGWLLLGYDILNLANAIGRLPLSPMGAKRTWCKYWRQNPFGKNARLDRVDRIKGWKPSLGDFIQAAQVSDNLFGVGLSLGPMMGFIVDMPFAAYRYLSGDPVKFSFDPPDIGTLERMGAKGLKAAGAISSQGQVFSEMTHFWTYITAALSTVSMAGFFRDNSLSDMVEDPMNIAIPAPTPTDPLTIEVIQEQGLNIDQGVGWPYNRKKFISIGDFIDATREPCRANAIGFLRRHEKDWYGLAAAYCLDYITPHVTQALEPQARWETDDTQIMKAFWIMVKAPILPTKPMTPLQGQTFVNWLTDFEELYGKRPGLIEIQQKLDNLGVKYSTTYPTEPSPDYTEYFEPGFMGDD